jgi:hypothetical protein
MGLDASNFQSEFKSGISGVSVLVLVGGRPGAERFGEFPLALLDVLGRSVLMRTLDRIRAAGIEEVAVLSDTDPLPPGPASAPSSSFSVVSPECFWDEALQQFRRLARQTECVLVLRLGAWAEVNFGAMVDQHRRTGSVLTRACSPRGELLDVFAISSVSSSEAAALLRGELRDEHITATEHKICGYVNMLAALPDLRILALDAFAGESEVRPCGRELRPGVWLGKGACIHRGARVVAPAFIGDFCNVRRAAVVTRGSSLERHSDVDCATMIDNSSVMPYTRVGAGLDVEYSVVGFRQVHSLQRNATVDIADTHLVGVTTTFFAARVYTAVSWMLHLVPDALWQSISKLRSQPRESASETMSTTPALSELPLATAESQADSYPEMAATRRYGNE